MSAFMSIFLLTHAVCSCAVDCVELNPDNLTRKDATVKSVQYKCLTRIICYDDIPDELKKLREASDYYVGKYGICSPASARNR